MVTEGEGGGALLRGGLRSQKGEGGEGEKASEEEAISGNKFRLWPLGEPSECEVQSPKIPVVR